MMTKSYRRPQQAGRPQEETMSDKTTDRDGKGRFAEGNGGGPGRPPRPVETEYLKALSDALTLEDWREVVARAVTDAKQGDAKAREWLGRYALGALPISLLELAAREEVGIEPAHEVTAYSERLGLDSTAKLLADMDGDTLLSRAKKIADNGKNGGTK